MNLPMIILLITIPVLSNRLIETAFAVTVPRSFMLSFNKIELPTVTKLENPETLTEVPDVKAKFCIKIFEILFQDN